jgi:spermidine/putrescine transport system permease protein
MSTIAYLRRPNRVLQVYAILFLVVLYVPILLIPLFSFNDSIYVRFPLQGFTTDWFVQMWHRQTVWDAFWASIRVGVAVAILSTALGVIAARAITRYRMPGQNAVVTFIMMPLVIPTIIFGVALLALLSRVGVPLSLYTVALGHLIVCLPFRWRRCCRALKASTARWKKPLPIWARTAGGPSGGSHSRWCCPASWPACY